MQLVFDRGTLVIRGNASEPESLPGVVWDPRIRAWRAPAFRHSDLAGELARRHPDLRDEVRPRLPAPPPISRPELRPYQSAAVAAWELAGRRGVVSLPTGSGKTRTAIAAIAETGLRTLCLVPTRVLMQQWLGRLDEAGLGPLGAYGDGRRIEEPVTVATFASALRHMEVLGNRFDLLVVDEVHHFGSGTGDEVLEMCAAAARLGLTATPPQDRMHRVRLEAAVGPEVYRASVEDLAGRYLASFHLATVILDLTPLEREAYDAEVSVFRPVWRTFSHAVPRASWSDFVRAAARSDEGRRAIAAWRRSRALVRYSEGKRAVLAELVSRHRDGRILVFAADNPTAYAVARELLVQPITCDIGAKERTEALDRFARGEIRILVSARVLNEGIDVPAADIAVVVGGSQGAREYVQRVGRVLRPALGKEAVVYNLVTRGTFEVRQMEMHRRALASG
jgi:superfamily II DNA or RNA helicase